MSTPDSRQPQGGPEIQVPPEHYFEGYDDLPRFVSYFYQADLVRRLDPHGLLEVGVGNKTVSNYLRHRGIRIETCDFDEALEPDHVADVRDLPFPDDSFPLVTAFEVLEHLPWPEAERALRELHRVSSRHVLISVPHSSATFAFTFRFPFIDEILGRPFVSGSFHIPLVFLRKKFRGQHYWEMGRRNYPARTLRKLLRRYFRIEEEVRPVLQPYHHFFVLAKK
jgi:hypothetical protein